MPPRHTYWTIILGNQPTAFRSATREELLPTLRQLQSKHPDAVMMWFARGRLWTSQEEARTAFERDRRPAWRDRPNDDRPPRPKPEWHGRPPRPHAPKPEWRERPQGDRPRGPKPEWHGRPPGDRPRGPKPEWRERPQGDRPRGPKPEWHGRPPDERRTNPTEKPDEKRGERRGRDWRPGGEHRDPRDRFKVPRDVKRARFAARQRRKKKDEK